MRRSITIIFVLLFVNASYGQKWINYGAEWKFLQYSFGRVGSVMNGRLLNDTIVEQRLCQQIEVDRSYFGSAIKYFTYMSNDSIYFYHNGIFRTSMIYNSEIGDTLNIFAPIVFDPRCSNFDSTFSYLVDTVYYTQVDTSLLKTYSLIRIGSSLRWPYNIQFIEKIGFLNHVYPYLVCVTDGYNFYLCSYKDNEINWQKSNCSVGINDLYSHEVAIYPTLASNLLRISMEDYKNFEIWFHDVLGTKTYSIQIENHETQIDVSQWQRGVYLYSIAKDGVSQQKGKIVLE